MRSDREIRRIAQIDITNLTDPEYDRLQLLLGSDKYREASQTSSFRTRSMNKAYGGKVHRGRTAGQSAEKAR